MSAAGPLLSPTANRFDHVPNLVIAQAQQPDEGQVHIVEAELGSQTLRDTPSRRSVALDLDGKVVYAEHQQMRRVVRPPNLIEDASALAPPGEAVLAVPSGAAATQGLAREHGSSSMAAIASDNAVATSAAGRDCPGPLFSARSNPGESAGSTELEAWLDDHAWPRARSPQACRLDERVLDRLLVAALGRIEGFLEARGILRMGSPGQILHQRTKLFRPLGRRPGQPPRGQQAPSLVDASGSSKRLVRLLPSASARSRARSQWWTVGRVTPRMRAASSVVRGCSSRSSINIWSSRRSSDECVSGCSKTSRRRRANSLAMPLP